MEQNRDLQNELCEASVLAMEGMGHGSWEGHVEECFARSSCDRGASGVRRWVEMDCRGRSLGLQPCLHMRMRYALQAQENYLQEQTRRENAEKELKELVVGFGLTWVTLDCVMEGQRRTQGQVNRGESQGRTRRVCDASWGEPGENLSEDLVVELKMHCADYRDNAHDVTDMWCDDYGAS